MPFSVEQFFGVFSDYNQAVWPLQLVAFLAGIVAAALLWSKTRAASAIIVGILSAMWFVNGIGYHLLYFQAINPLARLFGVAFVLQGLLLAYVAAARPELRFRVGRDPATLFGMVCIVFALLLYPAVGWLAGDRYPAVPEFGIAPCPTTIFTIGVLLHGQWQQVRWLLVIPGLWACIGGSASFMLGVPQDYALFATLIGLVVIALGHWRGWRPLHSSHK
jgi:hypothetical protein